MSTHYATPNGRHVFHADHVDEKGRRELRPVVVIDPDDREEVERLLAIYHGWKWARERSEASIDDMQAALREFAKPKPPEPTGLGAVVRSSTGVTYVRLEGPGEPWFAPDCTDWCWSEIDVVKVLSEGVTE